MVIGHNRLNRQYRGHLQGAEQLVAAVAQQHLEVLGVEHPAEALELAQVQLRPAPPES